jgi:Cof subfamily protein (haloacid dehalogenase superfamily)
MAIKLICSDIDGTLLNKNRELSTKTISEIKRLSKIPFILISSRMPKAMVNLQNQLDIDHLPLIAYNGGLIINKGEIIDTTEITSSVSEGIANFCTNTTIHLSLYHNNEWYVPEMDYWAKREQNNTKVTPIVRPIIETLNTWRSENKGAHKIMCMGEENEIDFLVKFIKNNYISNVIGYRSKPTYLEISHRNISKKTAIETLLNNNYPEVTISEVMAFGDNYNDINMLESVGQGVAVKNAKKEVLSIADKITESNINDGVAIFLEDYFD